MTGPYDVREDEPLPAGAVLRAATAQDIEAIKQLHDRVFGPGRFARTAYRIREGTEEITAHCRLLVIEGTVVGAVRMTPVLIGGISGAVLLGPLVVDSRHQRNTFGRRLVRASVGAACSSGAKLGRLGRRLRVLCVTWLPTHT